MIRVPAALANGKLNARMLLQVHDELVSKRRKKMRAPPAPRKRIMEKATLPAISLSVPLIVEARAAANWDEAH